MLQMGASGSKAESRRERWKGTKMYKCILACIIIAIIMLTFLKVERNEEKAIKSSSLNIMLRGNIKHKVERERGRICYYSRK